MVKLAGSINPALSLPPIHLGLRHVVIDFRPVAEMARRMNEIAAKFRHTLLPLLDTLSEAMQKAFDDAFRPGTFLGDWSRVTSSRYPEIEREEAAERLAVRWFKRPIHPRRWRLVEPELLRRAGQHGTSMNRELQLDTIQALPVVFAAIPEDTLIPDFITTCRAPLANILMDDLAGPGWRRAGDGKELALSNDQDEPLPDEDDLEYQAELAEAKRAIRQAIGDLPHSQRNAILARIENRPLTNCQHQALYRLRRSPSAVLRLIQAAS